jgi:REP element-mobilizing transposase RayT
MHETHSLPERRSLRLEGYDYSQGGVYFVTICTEARLPLLGEIIDGQMLLSTAGEIAADEWLRSAELRTEVNLDEFVVMPNHLHGLVILSEGAGVGAHGSAPAGVATRRPRSLSTLIAGYKAYSSKLINELRHGSGCRVWQRNYHEHIVRDEDELERIREYIRLNPAKWAEDVDNPAGMRPARREEWEQRRESAAGGRTAVRPYGTSRPATPRG